MFDCPDMTPVNCAAPIVAHERVVARPGDDSGGWRLSITPDVQLVSGGTAIMPTSDGIAGGDLPHPWSGPVTHADRRLGATRGALTFLR
jgi:hypothetical protein